MFGSEILDVAVGMMFVFLLLALIVTAYSELASQLLALRSRTLEDAIRGLLAGDGDSDAREGTSEGDGDSGAPKPLADRVLGHPLIASMSRAGWADELFGRAAKPSYLDKTIFAATLIDTLRTTGAGTGSDAYSEVRAGIEAEASGGASRGGAALLALANRVDVQAAGDGYSENGGGGAQGAAAQSAVAIAAAKRLEALEREIESWFDQVMDRASGWYKRRVQYLVVIGAIALSVFINADAIAMGDRFLADEEIRAGAAAAAATFVEESDPANLEGSVDDLRDQLSALALPLGWGSDSVQLPEHDDWWEHPLDSFWWTKALGLAITAFAISLGAPFWFDLLSKVVRVRQAGGGQTPPDRSHASSAGGAAGGGPGQPAAGSGAGAGAGAGSVS